MSICSFAQLDLPTTLVDADAADNFEYTCRQVTSSFDPNDIRVAPLGDSAGFLRLQDTVLAYQVRFQNTGTDTAFRVAVRDTLDPSLDITSISMGAASNVYTWKLEANNILVITFNNILLPDSNVNEPASHGVVKYTLHLRHGLSPGTSIKNRVGIYFDFNVVVMTNEVESILPIPSAVSEPQAAVLSVRSYPNPARDDIHIDGVLLPGSPITLRSIIGAIVRNATAIGSGHEQFPVDGLPSGVYLMELRTTRGRTTETVTIAR
jgi:uncharacterized repeat protein (TIGR01451 family)